MPIKIARAMLSRNAERNSSHRRPTVELVAEERCVGAEPEEHGVADRNLTCVTTDDIPGGRGYRGQQKRYANVEIECPGKNKWIDEQGRCQQNRRG